jgi:hypothetical protein
MRLAHAVRLGGWLLVALNLLMALGTIEVFMRMAPAIEGIIERNERSLKAGEEMLAALALAGDEAMDEQHRGDFSKALDRAQNNVTETDEAEVLAIIARTLPAAFAGKAEARRETVAAIVRLGEINRAAMVRADFAARQLGHAGAWVVVFMAICIFLAGLIFIRGVTRGVVRPLEEVHAVIMAQRRGETMRRCSGADLPQEARLIFSGINEILDQRQFQAGLPGAGSEQKSVPGKIIP